MKLDLENIKAEANKLVDDSLLAKIELTNMVHVKIGGYTAWNYSKELDLMEGLRTSEVKGIWRWWFRAVLGGALWDLQKEPNQQLIVGIVKELMGSTASASKLTLAASHPYVEGSDVNELQRVPRIRLISLGNGSAAQERIYPPRHLKVDLLIRELGNVKLDRMNRRVAFGTLLLALLLQGVGAITRRGFGRFQLIIKSCVNEFQDYCGIINAINQTRNKEEMQRHLETLFNKVLQDAKEKLQQSNKLGTIATRSSAIPPFPVFSKDPGVFKFKVLDVKANKESELLEKLGRACMKLNWKTYLGLGKYASGALLDTWILGLPRKVSKTGYYIKNSKEERRPSAIILSPIKKLQQSFLVAVFGFLSKDWPIKDLQWSSKTKGQHEVTKISNINKHSTLLNKIKDHNTRKRFEECIGQTGDARIKCAFNIAFDMVERLLTSRQ